jgi:citrate lyase beta subunit
MPINPADLCLVFQTLLFVPGNRMDRVAKAHESTADIVCIDLEDAVPGTDKAAAREAVIAFLGSGATSRTAVRINGLRTREGLQDLLALSSAENSPSILLVPMVESAAELEIVGAAFAGSAISIIPLVETVAGLSAVARIGRAPGVASVMFGGGDLSAQMGADLAWEPMLHARSRFVIGCVEAGVRAVDVPFMNIRDEQGLLDETRKSRALGFAAKAVIHPNQLDTVKHAMMPDPQELEQAAAAVKAYREAGGRAIMHNGMMLDEPIVRRLESLLTVSKESNNA